jgi:hypothetical protein
MSMMAEAMANLSELSSLSKALNEESNQVNALLLDIEKKLIEMNLGVEAWATIMQEPYTEGEPGCNDYSYWSADTQVGFSKWHDEWKLMVRTVHFEETQENWGIKEWKKRTEDRRQPLLQASRDIRLKAMASLEALFDELVGEAKRVLSGIGKGKQAYKKLASE